MCRGLGVKKSILKHLRKDHFETRLIQGSLIRLWTLLTMLCASVAATSVRRGTLTCQPWWTPCPSFARWCCGSEHQALDLSWYQLANRRFDLDEIETLTPRIVSTMNGSRSEVRDGSFVMASLMGKRHARPLAMPRFPTAHFNTLAPVRRLLDQPEWFPNLSIVGVTPLAMEHGPVFGSPCER